MRSLKARLQDDLSKAVNDRNELRASTLKSALNAINDEEVAGRWAYSLSDDAVSWVLAEELKLRQEAPEALGAAGQPELAARERAASSVLKGYLSASDVDDLLGALNEGIRLRPPVTDDPHGRDPLTRAETAEWTLRALQGLSRQELSPTETARATDRLWAASQRPQPNLTGEELDMINMAYNHWDDLMDTRFGLPSQHEARRHLVFVLRQLSQSLTSDLPPCWPLR